MARIRKVGFRFNDTTYSVAANQVRLARVVVQVASVISAITVGVSTTGGADRNVKPVIYDDNAGVPNNLVLSGSQHVIPNGTTGNRVIWTGSQAVAAGTYWVGFLSETAWTSQFYNNSLASSSYFANSITYASGPANPFSGTGSTQQVKVFVDLEPDVETDGFIQGDFDGTGTNWPYLGADNRITVRKFTISETGDINKVLVEFIRLAGYAALMRPVVYSHNAGTDRPDTLLSDGPDYTLGTGQMEMFLTTPVAVVPGDVIWAGFHMANVLWYMADGATSDRVGEGSDTFVGGSPATWPGTDVAGSRERMIGISIFQDEPNSGRVTQGGYLALYTTIADGARVTQGGQYVLYNPIVEGARVTQGGYLALYEPFPLAQITQGGWLALLDYVPCVTQWATCWRIARTDGVVFRFTDHDVPVPFQGQDYSPCDSLNASAAELAATMGSVGNLEAAGIVSDESISESDLFNGLFDGADVEIWIVPWSNAGGEVPWRLAAGKIGKVGHGDRGYLAEVLTPGARLQQQPLLRTYTPQCKHQLGDSGCTVDIEALRVTGTVTHVPPLNAGAATSRRQFQDTSRIEDTGYFDVGILTWTSGRNAGLSAEVKSYTQVGASPSITGEIVLWGAMPHRIEAGDAYSIVPGCDLLPDTCKDKFNNFINYGGYDKLPGESQLIETPNAKS